MDRRWSSVVDQVVWFFLLWSVDSVVSAPPAGHTQPLQRNGINSLFKLIVLMDLRHCSSSSQIHVTFTVMFNPREKSLQMTRGWQSKQLINVYWLDCFCLITENTKLFHKSNIQQSDDVMTLSHQIQTVSLRTWERLWFTVWGCFMNLVPVKRKQLNMKRRSNINTSNIRHNKTDKWLTFGCSSSFLITW